MFITAAFLAFITGALFRLVWAKAFMESKMFYVPFFWVVTALVLAILSSPKSGVFVIGLFIYDLTFFLIKGNKELEFKFKNLLNKLLSFIPTKVINEVEK